MLHWQRKLPVPQKRQYAQKSVAEDEGSRWAMTLAGGDARATREGHRAEVAGDEPMS